MTEQPYTLSSLFSFQISQKRIDNRNFLIHIKTNSIHNVIDYTDINIFDFDVWNGDEDFFSVTEQHDRFHGNSLNHAIIKILQTVQYCRMV